MEIISYLEHSSHLNHQYGNDLDSGIFENTLKTFEMSSANIALENT